MADLADLTCDTLKMADLDMGRVGYPTGYRSQPKASPKLSNNHPCVPVQCPEGLHVAASRLPPAPAMAGSQDFHWVSPWLFCISPLSLHAGSRLFSSKDCPIFLAHPGYMMDAWEEWWVMCLAALSVEDVEDIYLFGTMVTGFLLMGLGIGLVYRVAKKTGTAVRSPTMLPGLIDAVGRAVSTQTVTLKRDMDDIKEKLVALQRQMDRFMDQNGQRE